VSQSPAANTTGVGLFTPVVVKFSELMSAATISTATIHLRANGATTDVAATVSYAGSTVTLQPSAALAGNTTYTVTISGSVTDSSGNALGSNVTWSFTTGTAQWQQTSVADFSTGTQSGTTVTNSSGGEVQLAPQFFDDFAGTALSSAWTTTPTGGGTSITSVSGSVLSIWATEVDSVQTYTNAAIEGKINFGAVPYQHFGLATSLASAAGNYWTIFSTSNTSDTLFARVNVNGTTQDLNIGALPSGFHLYRIQPIAGAFQFLVDGVVKATVSATFPTGTPLKIILSIYNGSSLQPPLQADWVRIASYPSSGTFTSSVFDATRTATWGAASWTANIPAGTTITVQTRSGNTATPDGTWSGWATVVNGNLVTSPNARYLQYQVILTTSDPTQTPTIFDISFAWS